MKKRIVNVFNEKIKINNQENTESRDKEYKKPIVIIAWTSKDFDIKI